MLGRGVHPRAEQDSRWILRGADAAGSLWGCVEADFGREAGKC